MGMWRRIPRELKTNWLRYGALFFLIALGVYIVVGVVGAADSITATVQRTAVQNKQEDGEFTLFLPLDNAQVQEIEEAGVCLEKQFFLDFEQADGSTVRVFKNRKELNLFSADTGEDIAEKGEVLLEKLYAASHGLSVGAPFQMGGLSLVVGGIGSAPDYDLPLQNLTDVAADKNAFGVVFVEEETYALLLQSGQSLAGEEYSYAYGLMGDTDRNELKEMLKKYTLRREEITEKYLLEILDRKEKPKYELLEGIAKLVRGGASLQEALAALGANGQTLAESLRSAGAPPSVLAPVVGLAGGLASASEGADALQQGLVELEEQAQELSAELFDYKIENLISFLPAENNPRIAASVDDIAINKTAGILAGIIATALFAYVLSTFVLQSIEQESQVIGTLFALGMPKNTLMHHYLVLPFVVTLLGGIIGTVLGFSPIGVSYQLQDTAAYYSFPQPLPVYPLYLLFYGLVIPPLIAILVNWLVIQGKLNRAPLQLLRKQTANRNTKGPNLEKLGFISMFRIRQILREKRASLIVFGGMFIALLLLMLSVNCYSMIRTMEVQNESDILFEYMTILKYPPEHKPPATHAAYIKSLKKEIHGFEMDVSLLGLAPENPYFDFAPKTGMDTLTISSSVAKKFNVRVGELFYLTDDVEGKHYAFTIDRIVPYSPGLYVFMNINSMQEIFNLEENSFNVLFSINKPLVESGRILSLTRKSDIIKYGKVFMELMTPMIVMLLSVSIVIFVIVLYLMLKMMVDRSSTGISLLKVFGYNNREVQKLYMDGHFITVFFSALVGVPLAKMVMDAVYPLLIANVTFGPDMRLSVYLYAAIYALIFVSYVVISLLLKQRLKKITANEILKQRE